MSRFIFFSIFIRLIRYKIKGAKHIFPQKKTYLFESIGKGSYTVKSELFQALSRKKYKQRNRGSKMNFSPNFFIFFYFFFQKNFFIFWDIWKRICRFWRAVDQLPIHRYQQIRAISSNGGPGGRLAPPASKSNKKMCVELGHSHHCYRLCGWGHTYQPGRRENKR